MSNQVLKQLKIKTSMLKRLKKQYESYQKETNNIQTKIENMEKTNVPEADKQQQELVIKKNNEFLQETKSVLSNVKQKLIEAFEGLANFLSQKSDNQEIANTEQKNQAQTLVLDVETFLENLS